MVSEIGALNELRQIQSAKQRGARCTAGLLIKTLPAKEREAFAEALKDEMIDSSTISVWLERKGYSVRRHTVARHRRGECQCHE